MSKGTKDKKQEEDESTLKLYNGFRKRCDNYGIAPSPVIKGKLDELIDGGKNPSAKFQTLHCTEQIGPMQIRAFMEVATQLKYEHLKKVRIWKGAIGDEGIRQICKYLSTSYSLQLIDVIQNEVSPLGCEFLAKPLASPLCKVKHLKLDDNLIMTEGLKQLAMGLRINSTLDKLSLKYCGIDGEGSKYIQQILANIDSKLRSLKLQGNQLGNESAYQVLRAVQNSDSLQKINMADTGMKLLDYKPERQTSVEVLAHQMVLLMTKNTRILKYDIRFNPMHNDIADQLLKAIQGNSVIKKMEFPNNVSYDLRDTLDSILRKRSKKRGGAVKKIKKK